MRWLAISLCLLALVATSGCWRPYYGNRWGQQPYGQPAFAPPAVAQPYAQPVVQQGAPVVTGPPVIQAGPPVMQAAPAVQQQSYQYSQPCVPCQPNPCCVPCY